MVTLVARHVLATLSVATFAIPDVSSAQPVELARVAPVAFRYYLND